MLNKAEIMYLLLTLSFLASFSSKVKNQHYMEQDLRIINWLSYQVME